MERYFTIMILDSCGDVYDELHEHFTTLKESAIKVLEMKKHDKELGDDFGIWDYRIVEHNETEDEDEYQIYKLYKYRGIWKVKPDYDYVLR